MGGGGGIRIKHGVQYKGESFFKGLLYFKLSHIHLAIICNDGTTFKLERTISYSRLSSYLDLFAKLFFLRD